jgi:predicted nucleic acid-binding protein
LDRIEKLEILRASFEVVNTRLIQALRFRVDRGEAAAIALAAETPQAVVVLDDRKARVTAQGLSIPIIGTVGLLLRAKRLGILTEVRPVIDELAVAGFHLSVALRRKVLELASEFDGP